MRIGQIKAGQAGLTTLSAALNKKLSFGDQFNSFLVVNLTIKAGQEKQIVNNLRKNGKKTIPQGWQVMDVTGTFKDALGRGPTNWTTDFVHLRNFSNADGNFTIRFFEQV